MPAVACVQDVWSPMVLVRLGFIYIFTYTTFNLKV
jgi:hypothetical protein